VRLLFQDSVGRLWTYGQEIACFDGVRFFYLRDYGLPPGDTVDVSEDPSGAIWIASERGVFRFADGHVDQIASGVATDVIPVSADLILAAIGPLGRGAPQEAHLLRIRRVAGRWIPEDVRDLHSPGRLTLDHAGNLLYPILSQGFDEVKVRDVATWKPGSPIAVQHHTFGRFPGNGPIKVLRGRTGCVWLGASGGDSYNCGQGFIAAPDPTANLSAWMHESADGTMVLSGNDIIAVGRPGAWQVARRANGLPGIQDALLARDGTVWLATNSGLYRFPSPFRIEYWTIRDGVTEPPWSFARIGGRIFAGLDRHIVSLNTGRARWESIASYPLGGPIASLLTTERDTLLAAFQGASVAELTADGHLLARAAPEVPPCCAMRLVRGEPGDYWVGGSYLGKLTRAGNLLHLDQHALTQPPGNVLGLKYQSQSHKLWACYNGGLLSRTQNGAWHNFTTRNGLAVNPCWSLALLPEGDLWYAYFGLRAFARLRLDATGHTDIRQFGPDDGTEEPGDDVLETDSQGRLWRSAERGIYVADPRQAENHEWLRLDQSDGFPANDMNSGSVFVDTDGSLWWGADNDLAHYTPPPDLVAPANPPEIFVSAFSWQGGEPRLAITSGTLPRGAAIVAHIGSLQFERRNGLRLRYRVLPDRPSWRETASLDLPLGALGMGAHTLEVQARLMGGPFSGTVTWPLLIPKPFLLTWPMLTAYAFAFPLMAAAILLLYRRRRAEEAQLLPDLASWRVEAMLPDVRDLNGTLLDGRFRVGKLLARGGFATVMEGYDRVQEQPCAIKIFRSEVKDQAWLDRRFRQEVTALERVRHPNVVTIYAHGQTDAGTPYVVMEYIAGRSLREVLEGGAIASARVACFLRQLGGALDAIHSHGICHRDLKPENIIVRGESTPVEQAILIDFSIAIVKDADETLHGLSRAAGTFDYMSPEQAIGYAESSSDIYSLAKIVIEMLTGRRLKELLPDAALDLPDRATQLLRELNTGLSADSIATLASALAFDPVHRPSVAGEFADTIARDL
jgi:tRNA A-37 threonylcarbamoyl transferase component Bud32/ligand-binding sensor domain-containing protein